LSLCNNRLRLLPSPVLLFWSGLALAGSALSGHPGVLSVILVAFHYLFILFILFIINGIKGALEHGGRTALAWYFLASVGTAAC